MLAMRRPSSMSSTGIASSDDMARGLLARDAPERGADGHADSSDVTLAQHVAGHDLACSKNIMGRAIVLQDHLCLLVDRNAEVGERDAGSQWVCKKRRRIDGPRPMRLGRRQSLRRAIGEHGVIEVS